MDLSTLLGLEAKGRVGRARGKAILVGEHFVVHGGPALAVPVAASISVTLGSEPGWSGPELAQRGIPAMLDALGLSALAARLGGHVEGELPLGAGLGGSAALAAALLRALGVEEGRALAEAIHRCEKVAHGRPSGLDGLTVALERPVWLPATVSCTTTTERTRHGVDTEANPRPPGLRDSVLLPPASPPEAGGTDFAAGGVARRNGASRDGETGPREACEASEFIAEPSFGSVRDEVAAGGVARRNGASRDGETGPRQACEASDMADGPLGRAGSAETLDFSGATSVVQEGAALPLMVAVVPREGTTRLAVERVAAFKNDQPEVFAALFAETAALAEAARDALVRGDWPALGRALDLAHEPLARLGLVSARQEALVTAARQAGALGAKLSGAGLGGAVVLCHDGGPQSVLDLEAVLRQAGAVQVFSHSPGRLRLPATSHEAG